MPNFIESKSNLTQIVPLVDRDAPVKAALCVTPCVIFLYVKAVMIFTLRKKTVFQEASHYILFGHMLWLDTLHHFMSCLTKSGFDVTGEVCGIPLRYAEITSYRRTNMAIGVVWMMGLIQCLSELIIFYSIDTTNSNDFVLLKNCSLQTADI
ncbi:hypothetical protein ABG768_015213 [Culter alburnus]|uniref:Uncharacterized protein n=1 Tax=Culter alburnus TaxID=194366 RepID=A0AAW1Z4N4_CULAL